MHRNTRDADSFFFCDGAEHLRTNIREMQIVAQGLFTSLSKAVAEIAHCLLSPEIRFFNINLQRPRVCGNRGTWDTNVSTNIVSK